MANTLTDLIPDLYAARDVISRELVGFIPAVSMDASVNRAAVDQSVRVHVVPQNSAGTNITPAMSVPAASDQVIGNQEIKITKAKAWPFSWEGNEQDSLDNNGAGYMSIRANQIAQAMRAAVNEIEADLAALHITTSRAYGTAGATPFATSGDFTDATESLKILKDNGAPVSDNHLILDTSAGAKFLGKQANSSVEYEDSILRQGVFRTISGMDIRESGQVATFTKGTAANSTVNNDGYAKGATVLTLSSAGTGTILAGDVITIANQTQYKYVVTSGDADVSNGGTITIAEPGLRVAIPESTQAIVVLANSVRNMAFNRSAIILATRLPERPREGDMALDAMTVTDPRSGISFEVAMYPGYRKVRYEIAIAWGVKNIAPRHTALLLG